MPPKYIDYVQYNILNIVYIIDLKNIDIKDAKNKEYMIKLIDDNNVDEYCIYRSSVNSNKYLIFTSYKKNGSMQLNDFPNVDNMKFTPIGDIQADSSCHIS